MSGSLKFQHPPVSCFDVTCSSQGQKRLHLFWQHFFKIPLPVILCRCVHPAIIIPPSLTSSFHPLNWICSHGPRTLSRLWAALNVSDCCVIAWLYNFHPRSVSFICPAGLITITAIWLMLSFRRFHSPLKRLSLCIYPYPKHLIISTELSSLHRQVLIQEMVVPSIGVVPQIGSLRLCSDCFQRGQFVKYSYKVFGGQLLLAWRCSANPKLSWSCRISAMVQVIYPLLSPPLLHRRCQLYHTIL